MILSQRIIASWAILNDSLNPSQLVVTLTCKRVDSSIVIWEELNERACVAGVLGAREEKLCNSYPSGFSECAKPNDIFWFLY